MKIIDRYVYAVIRNLPHWQREEVEREVRNLIKDRMNELGDALGDEQKAEKVLSELGDPNILAQKYSGNKRYLVGPQNYHNYTLVLRIVLGAVIFAITLGTVLGFVFSGEEISLAKTITSYISSLISGSLQGFIWVTIVFVILEYRHVDTNKKYLKGRAWNIYDLPQIPQNKAMISKSESIFSIIFSTVFIMILYFAPQYFGIYIPDKNSGYTIFSFFNVEILSGYKVLLFGVFLTTLIKEVLKIIAGRWSMRLGISVALLNIVGLFILILIFKDSGVFNSSLPAAFLEATNLKFDAAKVWNIFRKWFLVAIAFGYIIDTLSALYKGARYGD